MAERHGAASDPGVLGSASVERVQAALRDAGSEARVIALEQSARSAAEAAAALGAPVGAIVKTLVLLADDRPFLALVAGDRRCDEAAAARTLGAGRVTRPDAATVRAATGFAIGGVAPVGGPRALPVLVDESLWRFATVWAAGGHPHAVFATTADELLALSGGRRCPDLAPH